MRRTDMAAVIEDRTARLDWLGACLNHFDHPGALHGDSSRPAPAQIVPG
jgi:hypothetical protein